jgi:hypothetical protein
MPGLLGEVGLPVPDVPAPEVPGPVVPVPEVPVPELVLPVPELLLELPVLPLRSWRRQSSFAMPVSTSQRLELELAPLEELLGLLVLGLLVLGLLVLGLLVLGLLGLVLGLVVELLPLGLGEVWATERLAAPRNAAATAA